MMRYINLLIIVCVFDLVLFYGCKSANAPVQPVEKIPCKEGKIYFEKLIVEHKIDPLGDSVNCPKFIIGQRSFHIGDTLAIEVDQNFNANSEPVIGNKQVLVLITSKFGDRETYLLKKGNWPCYLYIVDKEFFLSLIQYNSIPLGNPSFPVPENGLLDIRTTGDTLIASYKSYCSGDTLRDTVAILPK